MRINVKEKREISFSDLTSKNITLVYGSTVRLKVMLSKGVFIFYQCMPMFASILFFVCKSLAMCVIHNIEETKRILSYFSCDTYIDKSMSTERSLT